ncbi:hypothetical protein BU26DRAFT_522373 [Trematosphaeria pertusa]|uniref:Uncharacterized protein n=1 Tax=Trematosphaeria pertusa TaxID=390896 RepID=A0A6A6I4K9_9PLEO|nr:uncharacterized protein BU26DRAFT_522373 [Trematosphaeria pertusa]KAF2244550.1 hypothetical protein BU26DRAFT_522373 [Trematosphaeria pertusa]
MPGALRARAAFQPSALLLSRSPLLVLLSSPFSEDSTVIRVAFHASSALPDRLPALMLSPSALQRPSSTTPPPPSTFSLTRPHTTYP